MEKGELDSLLEGNARKRERERERERERKERERERDRERKGVTDEEEREVDALMEGHERAELSPDNHLTDGCRRANSAHIRQSRPDYGLDFQVKVHELFQVAPFLLKSERTTYG